MKFKFLTLVLLTLSLNCQAAEDSKRELLYTSLSSKQLSSNPEYMKLSDQIHILKQNISIVSKILKNPEIHLAKYIHDTDGSLFRSRIAELQEKMDKDKTELAKKRQERKALILQLDPHCQIVMQ